LTTYFDERNLLARERRIGSDQGLPTILMPYTGKATKESNIYSFGIFVLEIVCGKSPLGTQATKLEYLVLLHIVWQAHEDNESKIASNSSTIKVDISSSEQGHTCNRTSFIFDSKNFTNIASISMNMDIELLVMKSIYNYDCRSPGFVWASCICRLSNSKVDNP